MNLTEHLYYISSNGVDHGPLTFKEATHRLQIGEFKSSDIGWRNGLSGWLPLKDIPDFSNTQTSSLGQKLIPNLVRVQQFFLKGQVM